MVSSVLVNIYVYVLIHWIFYVIGGASLLFMLKCCDIELNYLFSIINFKNDLLLNSLFVSTCCSIIGIPPFMGFWTKLLLLMQIGYSGHLFLIVGGWLLALFAILFYLSTLRNITGVSIYRYNSYFLSKHTIFIILFFNFILLCAFLFFNQIYLLVYLIVL